MPQLNPRPWFPLLVTMWVTLCTLTFPSILKINFPHLPNMKSLKDTLDLGT
nr:ATP synthase F0 subunit 8 [Antennatus tuberosus]